MREHPQARRNPTLVFMVGAIFGAVIVLAAFGLLRLRDTQDVEEAVVEAPAEGTGTAAEAVVEEPAQVEYPYDIAGRVVDDHDQPIAGAAIRAFTAQSEAALLVESDAEGRFLIAGVPLGLYTVEVSATAFGSVARRGVTPGGPELVVRLAPGGDRIGRVVREGQGVSGVDVLIGGPGLFPPERVISGVEGQFHLPSLGERGVVELLALTAELGSGFGTTLSMSEQSQIVIELAPAVPLVLDIRDQRTEQVVGSGIVSISAGPLHLLSISERIYGGRTEVRGLPQGTYFARVRAAGYLPWEGQVSQSEPAQRIALDPGASVSGVVRTPSGEPVADARIGVRVRDADGNSRRVGFDSESAIDRRHLASGGVAVPPSFDALTGADGRFTITGLPPEGRVSIVVEQEEFETIRSDSIEIDGSGVVEGVEITLEQSR